MIEMIIYLYVLTILIFIMSVINIIARKKLEARVKTLENKTE